MLQQAQADLFFRGTLLFIPYLGSVTGLFHAAYLHRAHMARRQVVKSLPMSLLFNAGIVASLASAGLHGVLIDEFLGFSGLDWQALGYGSSWLHYQSLYASSAAVLLPYFAESFAVPTAPEPRSRSLTAEEKDQRWADYQAQALKRFQDAEMTRKASDAAKADDSQGEASKKQ